MLLAVEHEFELQEEVRKEEEKEDSEANGVRINGKMTCGTQINEDNGMGKSEAFGIEVQYC
jgi:hypothetical protein